MKANQENIPRQEIEKIHPIYSAMLQEMQQQASPDRAVVSSRFFKTRPGEYSEGDVFVGISVPQLRTIAKKYYTILTLKEITTLLQSQEHEYRALALIMLTHIYARGDILVKKEVFEVYCSHTVHINNWDLVDVSVASIVGQYLFIDSEDARAKIALKKLHTFSQSASLWERRIAIVATHAAIKTGEHVPTFEIVTRLLHDEHDLIHKACGWMLREVGRYCGHAILKTFLDIHAGVMPRTMLRYALEHFPKTARAHYMQQKKLKTKK